jgi:hypothetical protein
MQKRFLKRATRKWGTRPASYCNHWTIRKLTCDCRATPPGEVKVQTNAPVGTKVKFFTPDGTGLEATVDNVGLAAIQLPWHLLHKGANINIVVRIGDHAITAFEHEISPARFEQNNPAMPATAAPQVVSSGNHLFAVNGLPVEGTTWVDEYQYSSLPGDQELGIGAWHAPAPRNVETGPLPFDASISITGIQGNYVLAMVKNKTNTAFAPGRIKSDQGTNLVESFSETLARALMNVVIPAAGPLLFDLAAGDSLFPYLALYEVPADKSLTLKLSPLDSPGDHNVDVHIWDINADVTIPPVTVVIDPVIPDLFSISVLAKYKATYVLHEFSDPSLRTDYSKLFALTWGQIGNVFTSFFGADPETGYAVAANIAGGALLVGDVGSIIKNAGREIGIFGAPTNRHEVILSSLGLLTEAAVLWGEVPDMPISIARALVASIGVYPLAQYIFDDTWAWFTEDESKVH